MPVSHLGGGGQGGRRGCFFYGCLTLLALFMMLLLMAGARLFFASRQLAKFVTENAEDHPAELTVVTATDEEIQAIQARLKAFEAAFDDEKAPPPPPFELSELEVNQLIQHEPELRGRVYVDFEPDKIDGKVALPLDEFSWFSKSFKGKYLNGEGQFTAKITDQGFLDVHMVDFKLGNLKDLPVQAKVQIRRENMARSLNDDENVRKFLKKMDRLEILKDKVRLVPRSSLPGKDPASPDRPATGEELDKAVDEFKKKLEQSPKS
jgi:hypothetical protein